MGGTFDPIHHGHLVAAEEALFALGLERVIFIPTGDSFHKAQHKVSSPEDRYMMTSLATLENDRFRVSRIEIDRHEPSYTVDTLREMRHWFPTGEVSFYFITGVDAVSTMMSWHEHDSLPGLCSIVAVTRPGYGKEGFEFLKSFPDSFRKSVVPLTIPSLSISSTEIRKRVKEGKNIRYLVPPLVEQYIRKKGLYREARLEKTSKR
ncbi:nicotinate-nucleotide adenylyltransferase [Dethiosulfovibrio salsuginis]|uniref:Probable nicotinate-nucleotide adenylyltransferase n=2 Tax=Dethiosulfovibrio salsuginis TaxID=561720 RepID=A0A1X7I3U6_9BACT|nr:nicotinate-nucleotide adenylyltransferase [Dethiosulfovibrio salsuginis]